MKYEYQHRRKKKYAIVEVFTTEGDTECKMVRWIEIQLNKHGWYHTKTRS